MSYIKLIDNIPTHYSVAQLKVDNPAVSFPSSLTVSLLEAFGLHPLVYQTHPVVDPYTHKITEGAIELIDGTYTQTYVTVALSTQEMDAAEEQLADSVREERDQRLAACDWSQVADAPLTTNQVTDWTTYRQALRDVPQQAQFPFVFTWPSQPL